MTYASAAASYREREILTATPGRLVVIVFDQLLVNLRRARMAMETNTPDVRVDAVSRAREAAMELLVTTDVERGGPIASNLRSIYSFVLRELITLGSRNDVAKVDALIRVAAELRDAFATIVAEPPARVPAA